MSRRMSGQSEGIISAVVLAAGRSLRMGRPKMALPWGETTVIGRVVQALREGGAQEVIVVTGGDREQVEAAVGGLAARTVFNPRYADAGMALSLQVGLRACAAEAQAALVALGDQPQIEPEVVRAVLRAYMQGAESLAGERPGLVVPSYQMRRGHPWLVDRSLWPSIFALGPEQTMRDVLNAHAEQIRYVAVDTPAVLKDLDTPQDYEQERP